MAGTALVFGYLSCRNVIDVRTLSEEIEKAAAYFEVLLRGISPQQLDSRIRHHKIMQLDASFGPALLD